MLFNKKSYYSYIKLLESVIYFKFTLILLLTIFLFFLIAYFFNFSIFLFLFFGSFLGIILGMFLVTKNKIKVAEMKMKLDLYDKIINIK